MALASRKFADVLRDAVSSKVSEEPGHQGRIPLAKLVPLVNDSGAELLSEPAKIGKGIADLPAVRSLCARIYSSGPPL